MVPIELMEYRYRALVLKKREVGETDRIYTFFTREAGKISALAKGVRKSEAKLASALETGSEVDITIVRTRGMGKVAGAILENSYGAARENFEVLRLVVATLNIFDKLVEPDESDQILFDMLAQYLLTMELFAREDQSQRTQLVDSGFFFQTAFHLGYTLQLQQCVFSGEKLLSGQRYILSPSQGGVINLRYANHVRDGIVVSEETIKALRLFGSYPLFSITKILVGSQTLIELERFRGLFLAWIRR